MANVYFAYSTRNDAALPAAPPARKKSRACDACSVRKTRCGDARPCRHCVHNKLECTELRQRKKSGPKSLRSKTLASISSIAEANMNGNYSYGRHSAATPHTPSLPHSPDINPIATLPGSSSFLASMASPLLSSVGPGEPLAFVRAPHLQWLPVPFAAASFCARAALVADAPYPTAAARFALASYALLVAETHARAEPRAPHALHPLDSALDPAALDSALDPAAALPSPLDSPATLLLWSPPPLLPLLASPAPLIPLPQALLPLVSSAAAAALEESFAVPPDQESLYLLACAELHMYGAHSLRHPRAIAARTAHLRAAVSHAAGLAPSFDPRRASELRCALYVCERLAQVWGAPALAGTVLPPRPLPAHVHPVCFAYARMLAALDDAHLLLPLLADPLRWEPAVPAPSAPHTHQYPAAKAKLDDAFFSGGHAAAQLLRQVLTGRLLLQYAPELPAAVLELELLAVMYSLTTVLAPRAPPADNVHPLVGAAVALLGLVPQLMAFLRAYLLLVGDALLPPAVDVLVSLSRCISMYIGTESKPLLADATLRTWFAQLPGLEKVLLDHLDWC